MEKSGAGGNLMYYLIDGGKVVAVFARPQAGAVFIAEPQPSDNHQWDGSAWVYEFTPEQVAVYRDAKILDVELTVDMPDESQVVIVNDTRTIAAIDSKMKAMQNNSLITSRSFEFVNGFRAATYADFQHINYSREVFEQKAFDAYYTVLDNHNTTPYTTEQSWKDDFDTEWEA